MAFKNPNERRSIKLKEYGINKSSYHSLKGYKYADIILATNNRKYDYEMNHDENGFISTENKLDLAPYSLLFLGDSFVECMFIDSKFRFPSIVERILNIKCLNAGMSGNSILSSIITTLIKSINNDNIKTVFYFVSVIDFHCCLYRDDNCFYNTWHYNSIFNNVDLQRPKEFSPNYRQYLQFIDIFYKINLISNKNCYFILSPFGSNRCEYILNDITKNYCIKNDYNFLDCTFNDNCDDMFYDGVHLNKTGSLKFANFFSEKIKNII